MALFFELAGGSWVSARGLQPELLVRADGMQRGEFWGCWLAQSCVPRLIQA